MLFLQPSTGVRSLSSSLTTHRLSIGSSINSKCFTTAFHYYISKNLTKQNPTYSKDNTTTLDLSSTGTQPSKHSSPLAINLDPIEVLFSTPPTSPQTLFDTLEDLPPTTTNPLSPRPSFDSIKGLANEPSPIPAMEPPPLLILTMKPPLPPLPPQLLTFSLNPPSNFPPLPPLGPNNPFPLLTREIFCEHCQRTQVAVDNLRDEMRFILNNILDRLNVLAYNY
uniref:Uncharacterized protein n=1 Tax=Tanacetum cinerariifolium TaxID=118510 RepID=A0A6L2NT64_TANCI|nr:hypothetical protein [Tanacetum cinerariifolium]